MKKRPHLRTSTPAGPVAKPKATKTSFLQALTLVSVAVVLFFALLEGGMALFGVQPIIEKEDPFVGFAANVPLFVPSQGIMTTAPNKKDFFNQQHFTRIKPPGTYRVFCLGGSTTYGRPYDDKTSFSGWLRELLPVADKSKTWEVINAGGISYASYRVAHLMEELVQFKPDLFIIYTGHNEFLEERTYSKIKKVPALIKTTVSLLAKTRTWSAMKTALQAIGASGKTVREKRTRLAGEVDAILEKSAGLDLYTRNDLLRENILQHFQTSLKRMVKIARSVGAQVIFVTPASNLKDSSPFKSQHTEGLNPAVQQRTETMLAQAKEELQESNWSAALNLLATAVTLDPRHAELQYRRGQALQALGRYQEAANAFRRARDEDVCPLRALTSFPGVVSQVASDEGAGLVDYVDLLAQQLNETQGHSIPGKEFFLDHVHPTIKGHEILAVALIKEMIEEGIVQPGATWGEAAIAKVDERIRGRINSESHALALANLARVFFWAQKITDAERLARQALEIADDYDNAAINATSTLATIYMRQGEPERAMALLYSSLEQVPNAIELRLQMGQFLLSKPIMALEKAAANLLLVSREMPDYDRAHELFGWAMVMRKRPEIAYPSLMKALSLNPNNTRARKISDKIRSDLIGRKPNLQMAEITLERYSSNAPRQLSQVYRDEGGNRIRDGIEVEFYENGKLKHFMDISLGQVFREFSWGADGKLL